MAMWFSSIQPPCISYLHWFYNFFSLSDFYQLPYYVLVAFFVFILLLVHKTSCIHGPKSFISHLDKFSPLSLQIRFWLDFYLFTLWLCVNLLIFWFVSYVLSSIFHFLPLYALFWIFYVVIFYFTNTLFCYI